MRPAPGGFHWPFGPRRALTQPVPAPDTERRVLRGHPPWTVPRVRAWMALLIGLGLMVGGAALVLVGAGILRPEARVDAPAAVPCAIGVVFVVVGAWLLAVKIGDGLRDARARRMRRTRPGWPWLDDHPRNPAGAWDDTGRRATATAALAVILALFLVPFNWVAFSARSGISLAGRVLFVAVTGAFDVLSPRRGRLRGVPRLAPGPVWPRVSPLRPIPPRPRHLDPRLARGAPAPRRVPIDRDPALRRGALRRRRRVDLHPRRAGLGGHAPPRAASAGSGGRWNLPIRLPLTEGPYETRLADRPPRYWEFEVRGVAKGVDFGATFLLPVYALCAPEGRGLPS